MATFLRSLLEHGMTCAEVAGFLCRDEDEVRKKAEQMNIPNGRSRGRRRPRSIVMTACDEERGKVWE
jgi:hypothetical protein